MWQAPPESDADTASGVCDKYSPAQHGIVIRAGLAPDQDCKTLAHEVTHSILHRDAEVSAAHRGDCELEAESAAFVILHHHGIDAGQYSLGYVAGWAGGDEEAVKGIKSSAQWIQSTAKRFLDGIAYILHGERAGRGSGEVRR